MDPKKQKFINELKNAGGVIYVACANVGIGRTTYYRWRDSDPEFMESVDEVMEAQVDYVEGKLMQLINAGDTTATIFYLKMKGRTRGWNDKQPSGERPQDKKLIEASEGQAEKSSKQSISKKVKSKKDYIVKLLKQQGKYTSELSMQVNITAQLLVRTEILAEEVLSGDHESVQVEISREGNERKTVSPKEKLYLDFVQQSQRALRALGMNTDSRERKADNDTLGEFLKEFAD